MEKFDPKKILKQNHTYFKEELLPYYILVNTLESSIFIDVEEQNLRHLLGVNKTFNDKYRNMTAKKFFHVLNNKNIDLFEIIDKQRYMDNHLTTDELHILRKNYSFITLFESLFSEPNIQLYKIKPGDNFDADYVHFTFINKGGGYIGIIGSDKNNYHYFNSVILENDNPKKYRGYPIVVKSIEKIKKEDFRFRDYKFVHSKRFITMQKEKKKTVKKMNLKLKKKEINTLLNNDVKIEIGQYGKNTIQIYFNSQLIEKNLKLDFTYDTPQKVADYINLHYSHLK